MDFGMLMHKCMYLTLFSGRDYNEIIAALDSLAGRFLLTKMTRNGGSADLYLTQNIKNALAL